MSVRAFLIPLTLSAALHGAALGWIGAASGPSLREPARPVETDWVKIDYVRVGSEAAPARGSEPPPRARVSPPAPPLPSGVVDAQSLLRDARKAREFLDYFERIKQRVGRTLRDGPEYRVPGSAQVVLYFILDGEGRLESVSAVPVVASDTRTRDLAARALRQSAPFDPIPGRLEARRILFRLTVIFGGD